LLGKENLGRVITTSRLLVLAAIATALLLLGLYSVLSVAPAVARDTSPVVAAISPDDGSLTGGTEVTITGTAFVGPSPTVAFGAIPATDVKVVSSSTITALAPAHSAGSVDVTVTTTATGHGTSATDPLDLFAYGPPRVTGLSPGSGPIFGGTAVTITGTSFGPDDNVSFGTTAATGVTVRSATALVATAPPGVTAGAVDVTVSTPGAEGGTSATSYADLYAYAAPKVTSLAPETGPADAATPITITGTNFSPGDAVGFGATPASRVIVWSPKVITAYSPATLRGDANVTVTNAVGKSPASVSGRFAAGAPTVTGISPEAGSVDGGTIITITGEGFSASDGVEFGNTPSTSVTVLSPTSLEATVPPGDPGSIDVEVTSPQGTSATSPADLYAYGAPAVTAVTPDNGPDAGGTAVTITGNGFVPGAVVSFGGTSAPGATVNSSGTSLEVAAPAGAAGSIGITVSTTAGTSAASTADLFAYGEPAVTGDIPGVGPPAGGNDVIVVGKGFVPGLSVSFGGVASSSVTVMPNGTSLFALVPPGTAGPVDITVKTPLGTSATNPDDSYFYGPPTVTGLTPASGSTAGGTAVTITGMGFSLGSTVSFGMLLATSVTLNSPTSITAITPAAGPGLIPVRVSTSAGMSESTAANSFQYEVPPQSSCSAPPSSSTSCPGTGTDLSSVNLHGQKQDTAAGLTRFLALTIPAAPSWAARWAPSVVGLRLSPSTRRLALPHPIRTSPIKPNGPHELLTP
jgi:IPT/TIG domain